MKVIQAKDLTDEQWTEAAKFNDYLKKEIYPEKWTGKNADWNVLKNTILGGVNIDEDPFSNYYYMFDKDNPVAFIDAFERRGSLYVIFDFSDKMITEEILKVLFEEINKIMEDRDKSEAYFITYYERHYEPVLKTGAEVYEEVLDTRLMKNDMDFSDLKRIADDDEIEKNYELKLFSELPEEIYERFVTYMNEIMQDSYSYHPQKRKINEYTMKDALEKAADIKDDECPFYMYMLFDKNNIAAHCAVFIDLDIKINKHWIDHKGAGYTAVGRNYRGKNLAKYLKAKMYLRIQEDFPDFEYVLTDTLPWNKHMYMINEEFGFKPFRKGYTFRFTKEFLKNNSL